MKTNSFPEEFIQKEGVVASENCTLVFPRHIGTPWNKQNLHFRSSMWNESGELISASFKKFFNWGEQPELAYTPFSTKANGGINVRTKEDGSTLIVSKYKGQLITRTRGTFCASFLENGPEINYLINKYPQAFELETDKNGTANYSLVYEWTTPNNIIVIDYGNEPDIVLLNKIYHEDYSLEKQKELDIIAENMGVKRPKSHYFNSIKELLEDVDQWEGIEGVCVYSKYDQEIRKIKASQYLALHRMKSEMGSFNRVVDVFFEMGTPDYQNFLKQIEEVYDYEIARRCMADVSTICDGWKKVVDIEKGMDRFVERIKNYPTRKEQAQEIIGSYGKTNRASFLFKKLDGQLLEKDDYKKLLYQVITK